MEIGIVGYQGSGRSTLFQWLTGVVPAPAHHHDTQHAMAPVDDARVAPLCEIYKPKKVTHAALEIVDTPGLNRTHEGSAIRLALIREADCLVIVVAAYGGGDALADLRNFEDDLLIADLDIVSGRIERLRDQLTRPRPDRDELHKQIVLLEPLQALMENGQALHAAALAPEQTHAIRSFQLFSEKPRLVIVNTADDDADPERFARQAPPGTTVVAVSLALQLELSRMPEAERRQFCEAMGVACCDRAALIRQLMDVSGQMLFFTAGDKEVRTWLIRKGGTALEAAAGVHTDLAHGFIRAEVMTCNDLFRLGSEREIKAHHLLRKEHKDYVIQDSDIIFIQHN